MKNKFTMLLLLSVCLMQAQQKTDDLIPFLDDRLYGYCDWDGNLVIKPDYEEAKPFDDAGLAEVVQFGLHGKINKAGKFVIPPFASKPLERQKLYAIDDDSTIPIMGLTQYYDPTAKKGYIVKAADHTIVHEVYSLKSSIPYAFGGILSSYGGISFPYGYMKICFSDSSTNVIDTTGQVLFKDNFYNIAVLGKNLFAIEDREGAVQIIDAHGSLISSEKFRRVKKVYREPYYITTPFGTLSNYEQMGILDKNGKTLLANTYSKLRFAVDDAFLTRHKNYSNYFINSRGDSLLTTTFKEIQNLNRKFFKAKDGNEWLLCDSSLRPISEERFKRLNCNSYTSVVFGNTDHASHFYFPDRTEPLIIDALDCTSHNSKSYQNEVVVYNGAKKTYQLYDGKGNTLIQGAFDEIRYIGINQSYYVKQGWLKGVYDLEKGWILPLQMWWRFETILMDSETHEYEILFDRDRNLYRLKDDYTEVLEGPELSRTRVRTSYTNKKMDYAEDRNGNKYYWSHEGNAQLEFAGEYPYFQQRSVGQKSNIFTTDGKQINPVGYWQNGNCKSIEYNGTAFFELAGEKQRGVVDQNGKWVVGPVEIDRMAYHKFDLEREGFVILRNQNGRELYDLKGNKINSPNHYKITPIHSDCLIIEEGPDRHNLQEYAYDRTMKRLFPKPINYTGFSEDGFFVSAGTESIHYDFQGNEINRYPTKMIDPNTGHNDFWKYKEEESSMVGVINRNGKKLCPPNYKYVKFVKPFLILIDSDLRSDILTMDGVLHDCNIKGSVDKLLPIGDDLFLSKSNIVSNVISAKGELVSSFDIGSRPIKEKSPISSFCLQAHKGKRTFYVNKYTGKKYIME